MIDLSELNPEKRAFLKANPELLKSLEAEIPRQVTGFQKRREKLDKGKAKWQRDFDGALAKAETLRREYDPCLREIQEKFNRKLGVIEVNGFGEGDKGNKMNGKPWCFKCKTPLMPKEKVAKWLEGR